MNWFLLQLFRQLFFYTIMSICWYMNACLMSDCLFYFVLLLFWGFVSCGHNSFSPQMNWRLKTQVKEQNCAKGERNRRGGLYITHLHTNKICLERMRMIHWSCSELLMSFLPQSSSNIIFFNVSAVVDLRHCNVRKRKANAKKNSLPTAMPTSVAARRDDRETEYYRSVSSFLTPLPPIRLYNICSISCQPE